MPTIKSCYPYCPWKIVSTCCQTKCRPSLIPPSPEEDFWDLCLLQSCHHLSFQLRQSQLYHLQPLRDPAANLRPFVCYSSQSRSNRCSIISYLFSCRLASVAGSIIHCCCAFLTVTLRSNAFWLTSNFAGENGECFRGLCNQQPERLYHQHQYKCWSYCSEPSNRSN